MALILGLDVLASGVSIAVIDGTDEPRITLVHVEPRKDHSPRGEWRALNTAADEVVEKLLHFGKPDLVVVGKQQWGAFAQKTLERTAVRRNGHGGPIKKAPTVATDSTAQFRLQLQGHIIDRLMREEVRVAEFPYPTALVWLNDGEPSTDGRVVMKSLEEKVKDVWGIEVPTDEVPVAKKERGNADVTTETVERRSVFRSGVVVLAAIGAMACGVETSVPVTDARLRVMRGEGSRGGVNRAIQWDGRRSIPETVAGWVAMAHGQKETR